MTVEAPKRTAWPDPRIDDLSKKVDTGFAKVDERFDKVDERFDKLMWRLLAFAGAIVAAQVAPHPW